MGTRPPHAVPEGGGPTRGRATCVGGGGRDGCGRCGRGHPAGAGGGRGGGAHICTRKSPARATVAHAVRSTTVGGGSGARQWQSGPSRASPSRASPASAARPSAALDTRSAGSVCKRAQHVLAAPASQTPARSSSLAASSPRSVWRRARMAAAWRARVAAVRATRTGRRRASSSASVSEGGGRDGGR